MSNAKSSGLEYNRAWIRAKLRGRKSRVLTKLHAKKKNREQEREKERGREICYSVKQGDAMEVLTSSSTWRGVYAMRYDSRGPAKKTCE